jgi:hypothetical protein
LGEVVQRGEPVFMEAEAFRSHEILFDLATRQICVLERFYGPDFEGMNLCEVTDGQGRYWLTRDYMLARFVVRPGVEQGDNCSGRDQAGDQ